MSNSTHAIPALFVCPVCRRALDLEASGDSRWNCAGCGAKTLTLAGVPCLFRDSASRLFSWNDSFLSWIAETEREEQVLREELKRKDLMAQTRDRLFLLLKGVVRQRESFRKLMAPLTHAAAAARFPAARLGVGTGPGASLFFYQANILRDWAYSEQESDEENARSLALVMEAAGPSALGACAVLGSGAGRLAADLHRVSLERGSARTVALDINPLLTLVANEMLGGRELALTEVPLAPRDFSCVAVERVAQASAPIESGFQLVLGDALDPPLADGAFDTVVTPWLIDVLPQDLRVVVGQISRLLKPGGQWLNFGPLGFGQPRISLRYSREEVLAITEAAGFRLGNCIDGEVPYLRSGASAQARSEKVVAFQAIKVTECPALHAAEAASSSVSPWLENWALPVSRTSAIQQGAERSLLFGEILAQVDGVKSVAAIAAIIGHRHGFDTAATQVMVRSVLASVAGH